MHEHNDKDLTGHPSDYGSRTLEETEPKEQRTADGEPRVERGTVDPAVSEKPKKP